MSEHREEGEGRHLLVMLLEQFVGGQYDLWQQVAGRRELLRSVLRQTVREASSTDVGRHLERCWELLTDDRTALRVAEFYRSDPDYEDVTVDHERVLLGALRLVATAQAAVAALQVGRAADAAVRLDRWSRLAVELFLTRELIPEHLTEGAPVEDPRELVHRAYERFGRPAGGALFWTLDWLDTTSAGDVMKVPIVGYHPSMGGFCADLRLRLIPGGGELVEHPDMALRPLGPELREVVRDACNAAASASADGGRSRGSVCWSLTVRDRSLDPLLPLDGGSLSGAATAGLLLLYAGGRYDPRSVIVARAEAGGQLRPVGFERDKLEAAASATMRQAIVAPGTALSEADLDDLEGKGLRLRKVANIADAVRFVRRRRKRALATLAAAAAVITAAALLVSVFQDGSRTPSEPPVPTQAGVRKQAFQCESNSTCATSNLTARSLHIGVMRDDRPECSTYLQVLDASRGAEIYSQGPLTGGYEAWLNDLDGKYYARITTIPEGICKVTLFVNN